MASPRAVKVRTPDTPGSSRPSTCQEPRETPSTGEASCCSRTRRVKGVPPHVPFHVPLRSGTGPAGIVSGVTVEQAPSSAVRATTSPFHRGFIAVDYTHSFVSHKPGVEVVVEAYTGYWRRVPTVKRYVMKSVPEGTTRVAMLKNGEADIAYALDGEDALNVKRDPRLQLVPSKHASIYWIEFAEQWDPKSPWHDKRVRLAANYALNRQAINEVSCLGYCPPTGVIVPRVMEFALQAPPMPYDPPKAKQLLAEAGYPNGIDAGDFAPTPPFITTAEAATNYLGAVGIRTKMRLMERAAFLAAWREKKLRGLFMAAVGNSGNAASRVEAFMYSKGSNAYGGYPDLDDLFYQQARERDTGKREALLHRIQQLSIDRVMFAPIMDYRTLRGVGPRVAEHMLDSMHLIPFPSYEDVRLKGQ